VEEAQILLSISEVCVGLAGFGGIAAGIGYRVSGVWLDHDRVRFIWLILYCLSSIFACFMPFAIFHLGFEQTWQIASMFFMLTPVLALRTLLGIISGGLSKGYDGASVIIVTCLHVVTVIILLAIIFGFGTGKEFGLYLIALLLLLLQASFLFLRLLSTAYLHDAKSVTVNNNINSNLSSNDNKHFSSTNE